MVGLSDIKEQTKTDFVRCCLCGTPIHYGDYCSTATDDETGVKKYLCPPCYLDVTEDGCKQRKLVKQFGRTEK